MLKIYNTLTRKLEEFKPIEKGLVKFYNCGPTVYDFAHIGNFRSYISQDLLRRYLKWKGYKVIQVTNITDVDDKTIKGSKKEGISLGEYTKRYEKAFFEDIKKLNIEKSEFYPRATEHIKEMIELIKKLMQKGFAYKADDKSIYYDISKFNDYGKLSHVKIAELKAGARVRQDEYAKEEAKDFVLWKAWHKEDGDVFWETEIGKGRPGWHIECSAMSMKYLGESFDIHAGGVDLIFPHHENEIAQSEAATGKKFVNYWMHTEHLLVDGKKMSKSLGNFYTLRNLDKLGFDMEDGKQIRGLRYLLLSVHYRQQLNFTREALASAINAVTRFDNFIDALNAVKGTKDNESVIKLIEETKKEFEKHMDNNLDISPAIASIFDFMRKINLLITKQNISTTDAKKVKEFLYDLDKVLCILKKEEIKEISNEAKKMIEEREKLRKKKDWKRADEIREKLLKMGIQVFDTPKGPAWKVVERG